MRVKKYYICHKCASVFNGRIEMPVNRLPVLDGNVPVISTFSAPSKKPKCAECGERIKHFWMKAEEYWLYKTP